ncbi:hypothetical protein [Paraburkholderia azotifigens]|uniref:Uncharacterized protein n=1 Tax=Paraburkholderia azotifigens TaxID=2057004 RepID=A0A5C6VF84_9BURK|nr:hypothetical protein [Paraburkholderia azotifigens]TXC83640.1 hypothetical protein FRZ40_24985 [Paraburkholderia azotifigens]
MALIYTVVRRALQGYHPFELQALGEDKEELISQFIYFKVFRFEATHPHPEAFPLHSAPSNGHAVCAYFRRYLIDCLRNAAHQRNVSFDDENVLAEVEQQTAMQSDPVGSVLIQYGLDEQTVRESAAHFIAGLDESDWLLLAGTLGWLSNEQGGLSQIAARYQIASYHYRARKLGVTLKKGSLPADFASTSIGEWITRTLGIDIAAENRVAILIVLGILSEQSQAPSIEPDPAGDLPCNLPQQA